MHPSILKLDLEPIVVKLMDKEEGSDWSLTFAMEVEQEYRRYLAMCLENPKMAVVPSSHVDEFWHTHILDTQKYADDCNAVFGEMLHHFPYFGMRNEQDAQNLQTAWKETKDKYLEMFDEQPNKIVWNKHVRCPNCSRRIHAGDDSKAQANRPTLAETYGQKTGDTYRQALVA